MTTVNADAFFIAGGTVPADSRCYIERRADRDLYEALVAGEFCSVLNSRQMGKSSLAIRTMSRLRAAGIGCAFVDLTRLGGASVTAEQWFSGLLVETGRALGLKNEAATYLRNSRDVGPVQRLLGFLQEVALAQLSGTIVLMIDEIDAVRSLPFSADDLFSGIRQLHNARASNPDMKRLTVCLLGAALPSDLIADPRSTPFNVGKRVSLRDFSAAEAQALAGGFAAGGQSAISRVLSWTGGHPFLTQALCSELATRVAATPAEVDRLVRDRYLEPRARDNDTNLADVANRLLGRGDPNVPGVERADTLSLYAKMLKTGIPDDETNLSSARIKMSGLARLEGGQLMIRNRIYAAVFSAAWIRDNMPGQELRRQQRAFRRGALRTGVAAGVIIIAMGTLAAIAINNAREAHWAQQKSLRSEGLAKALAESESKAKVAALDSAAQARTSLKRALAAEAIARTSATQEHADKLVAQQSATAARIAQVQAQQSAVIARKSESRARSSAWLARTSESRARDLLYASNMALTGQMMDHGGGIQMAQYLGLQGKSEAEIKNAGWEQRHFYAVLHQAHELRTKGDAVLKVAFTPGGHLITRDVTMRLSVWDPTTGALLHQMQPPNRHDGIASDVSRNGAQACLTLANGDIQVLSTDTLEPVKTIRGVGSPVELIEVPDAPNMMIGWFGLERRMVDLVTGRISNPIGVAPAGNYYSEQLPYVLPSKRLLMQNGPYGELLCMSQLDANDHAHVLWTNPGRSNTIQSMAVSSGGRLVAFSDWLGYAQVLDARDGSMVGPPLAHGTTVSAMAFDHDEQQIATSTPDGLVSIWRVSDGLLKRAFRTPRTDIEALAFSASGDQIAYGTSSGRIGILAVSSFADPSADLRISDTSVTGISISPEGKTIATASYSENAVKLIDSHIGKTLRALSAPDLCPTPSFSPDGRWIASGGRGSVLRVWDLRSMSSRTLDLKKDFEYVRATFSPDSKRLIVAENPPLLTQYVGRKKLALYDLRTLTRVSPFATGEGLVHSAVFSPDGTRIVAGWDAGRIALFDSKLGSARDAISTPQSGPPGTGYPTAIVFTPDGKRFVVGRSSGQIEVFDVENCRRQAVWTAHSGLIKGLAFTDGNHTLLSVSDDKWMRMWSLGKWLNVGELSLQTPPDDIAFSPSDSVAYVGDWGGHVHAYRTHYPKPAPPVELSPNAPANWEAELADAKSRKLAIFFPVFRGFGAYDRALRSFLMTDEMRAILQRHFVLFAPWQGSSIVFRGKLGSIEQFYDAFFGSSSDSPSLKVVDSSGSTLFNGTYTDHGKRLALGAPIELTEIEQFLSMLRRTAQDITEPELAKIKAFWVASGRPYRDGSSRVAKLAAQEQTFGASSSAPKSESGLRFIEQLIDLKPSSTAHLIDRATYLASLERWSEAADAFAEAQGPDTAAPMAPETFKRAACLTLCGNKSALRVLLKASLGTSSVQYAALRGARLCFGVGLTPGWDPQIASIVGDLEDRFREELLDPGEVPLQIGYALDLFRCGNLAESELRVRAALAESRPFDVRLSQPMAEVVLALILANEGRFEQARAQLKAANASFGRPVKDGELVAGHVTVNAQELDEASTAMFAVLRREVQSLLARQRTP